MGVERVELLAIITKIVPYRDRHPVGVGTIFHAAIDAISGPNNLARASRYDLCIARRADVDTGMEIFIAQQCAAVAILGVGPVDLIGGDRSPQEEVIPRG